MRNNLNAQLRDILLQGGLRNGAQGARSLQNFVNKVLEGKESILHLRAF